MAEEQPTAPTPLAEIEHGPSKFEQFLENNLKKLILGALILVLGVAAYIVVTGLKDTKDRSAGEALYSATEIADLRKVIDDFPATPASGSAAIFLASEQWKDGNQEDAINTLNTFLSEYPEHPARGNAQIALGFHLLEQNKEEEAKPHFEAVASETNAKHIAPFALLALGDLAKKAGDEEVARSYYDRALNDYPDNDTTTNNVVNERISLLGVVAPAKIAPPVEPAPEEVVPPAIPGQTSLTPTNPLLEKITSGTIPPEVMEEANKLIPPAEEAKPEATAKEATEETPASAQEESTETKASSEDQ